MSKPDETTRAGEPSAETTEKKPYEKPVLQVYGDLTEIVKSNTGTNMNDGAGHPNRHFTS